MTGQTAAWLLLLALLYFLYQWGVEKMRCVYCGKLRGHEDHCPFQGKP